MQLPASGIELFRVAKRSFVYNIQHRLQFAFIFETYFQELRSSCVQCSHVCRNVFYCPPITYASEKPMCVCMLELYKTKLVKGTDCIF